MESHSRRIRRRVDAANRRGSPGIESSAISLAYEMKSYTISRRPCRAPSDSHAASSKSFVPSAHVATASKRRRHPSISAVMSFLIARKRFDLGHWFKPKWDTRDDVEAVETVSSLRAAAIVQFRFRRSKMERIESFLNCWNVITPTSFNWHCLWASIWLTTCGERKLADWKIGRRSSRLFHKNFNNWERG